MSAPTASTTLPTSALERTAAFGDALVRDCPDLSRRGALRILRTLKRKLSPPRAGGRRRTKQITGAHADWKAGLCGIALYERHIPGFSRMSYWKKKGKIRNLMDAIRKRERRKTKPKTVPPNKSLA